MQHLLSCMILFSFSSEGRGISRLKTSFEIPRLVSFSKRALKWFLAVYATTSVTLNHEFRPSECVLWTFIRLKNNSPSINFVCFTLFADLEKKRKHSLARINIGGCMAYHAKKKGPKRGTWGTTSRRSVGSIIPVKDFFFSFYVLSIKSFVYKYLKKGIILLCYYLISLISS